MVATNYIDDKNLKFNQKINVYDPAARAVSTGRNILLSQTDSGFKDRDFSK